MSCAARLTFPQAAPAKVAHSIEPLQDSRWDNLVQNHPRASVFHSSPWLRALSRTYGYEPIAYTTSPAGQDLQNGIVFCRIESWLTGRRLVSLPFSDHCEPLMREPEDLEAFATGLEEEASKGHWRYI